MWGPIDIVSNGTGQMSMRYGIISVDVDDEGNGTGKLQPDQGGCQTDRGRRAGAHRQRSRPQAPSGTEQMTMCRTEKIPCKRLWLAGDSVRSGNRITFYGNVSRHLLPSV